MATPCFSHNPRSYRINSDASPDSRVDTAPLPAPAGSGLPACGPLRPRVPKHDHRLGRAAGDRLGAWDKRLLSIRNTGANGRPPPGAAQPALRGAIGEVPVV